MENKKPLSPHIQVYKWHISSLSPLITLKTPSGNPASFKSSANFMEQEGSFSDGFNTKVFPQAIAIGNIHIGTIAGKLKGVMLILGEVDKMVDLKAGKKFASLIKNSKTQILDRCGHMIMIEKAFEMREKVLEFLKK